MRPRRHPRHGLLRFGIGLLQGVGRGQQNPDERSSLNQVESLLDIQHIWDIWDIWDIRDDIWDIRDDIWDIRDDRSSFIPLISSYILGYLYMFNEC